MFAAAAGYLSVAGAQDSVPDLGRIFGLVANTIRALTPVPETEEIEIGRQLASMLAGAAPLSSDEELQRYVNRIGRWVALQSERPHLPWRFGVLDTDAINAFATPGGYVLVTEGLLRIVRSEAEIAGVLGHEISHVLKQHHLNAIRKQAQAAMMVDLGALVMDTDKRQLFDVLSNIGMGLYARGLERTDEYAADRIGVVLSARAGYDPFALPAFLGRLHAIHAGDARVSLIFSTHPPTGERIRVLAEHMAGAFAGVPVEAARARRFSRHTTSVR